MYKGWVKSNVNSSIFDISLFTVVHLCTFNIVALLIYHLFPNVWKASYTISMSIFVDVPYTSSCSTDKFISCVVPDPSQWFFHFDQEIVITWTQEKITTLGGTEPRHSSAMQGITPLALLSRTSCAGSNGRFWNIHRTHPI